MDFSIPFLDVSAARAVATISEDAVDSNKKIFISGMNSDVKKVVLGLQEESVSDDMLLKVGGSVRGDQRLYSRKSI